MARRRGFSRRSFGRRIASGYRRGSRRTVGGRMGGILHLDAMAYGAVRNPIAGFVTSKTGAFAGEYTDELVMGGIALLASKMGFARGIAQKALIVENANVGATLSSGFTGTSRQGQGGL